MAGRCKNWTVDFGLDCGLDYGLDRGLKFGLMTIISCCEIKLVLSLQLGCVCELLVDIGSDCLTQIHSRSISFKWDHHERVSSGLGMA